MKEKYYTPILDIEILDKSDVLLSSIVTPTSPTSPSSPAPKGRELENSYRDISDFIISGDWFS